MPNLSIQGNSAGQVNDPEVATEGIFISGTCDERFESEEEVTNHNSDAHDKATAANNSLVSESAHDMQERSDNLVLNDEADENIMFDSDDDKDLNKAFEELSKVLAS